MTAAALRVSREARPDAACSLEAKDIYFSVLIQDVVTRIKTTKKTGKNSHMPRAKPSAEQIEVFISMYAYKVRWQQPITDAQRSLAKRLRAAGHEVPQRQPGPVARNSPAELAAMKAKAEAQFPTGLFPAFRCDKCRTVTILNWKSGQRVAKARCEGCPGVKHLDRLPTGGNP